MDEQDTGHHEPNSLVDGRYRLSRPVGTRATTWCAVDERLNRQVLIRFLAGSCGDPQTAARYCTLLDDRLARLLDIDAGRRPEYVVSEWIDGISLADPAVPALPTDQIIEIVAEAAAALDVVHQAELVHGRLDAGNVFLDAAGLVKVAGGFVPDGDRTAQDDVDAIQNVLHSALRGRQLPRALRKLLRREFTTAAGFADALEPHRDTALRCRLVSPEPPNNPHRFAMRRACEVMATGVVTVSEDTPILEVAAILAASTCAAVPVLDAAGHITGLVTSSDLARWRLDAVPA